MNNSIIKYLFIIALCALSFKSEAILGQEKFRDAQDSLATLSLWHESHKNNDYTTALKHAWRIHKNDPTFSRYNFYSKFEEMLKDKYEKEENEDLKKEIIDNLLNIYDQAIKYDEKKSDAFCVRKAYVMETWTDIDRHEVIEAYEKAIKVNPNVDPYYKNRLGVLYVEYKDENEEYLANAIELYTKLSELEPDNPTWIGAIKNISEDPNQIIDAIERLWKLEPDNLEKAWKYASICLQYKEYGRALIPLEFLIKKSPKVINYWKKLSTVYDKLDRTGKAVNAYKTLIRLEPSNHENYLNLAIIYFRKLNQLSVARSYLYKASKANPGWDYPIYIEAQLYEQSARECSGSAPEFMDKCVYQLAVDTYKKAARKGGPNSVSAKERANALKTVAPTQEDYFFKQIKTGTEVKIEGKCYGWIGRSIKVP